MVSEGRWTEACEEVDVRFGNQNENQWLGQVRETVALRMLRATQRQDLERRTRNVVERGWVQREDPRLLDLLLRTRAQIGVGSKVEEVLTRFREYGKPWISSSTLTSLLIFWKQNGDALSASDLIARLRYVFPNWGGHDIRATMLNAILRESSSTVTDDVAFLTRTHFPPQSFNGDTVAVLLRRASQVEEVDQVLEFFLSKRDNLGGLSTFQSHLFVASFLGCSEDLTVTRVIRSFNVIDLFYRVEVGASSASFSLIIRFCLQHGMIDTALRGWREMRRAWLGAPNGQALRELMVSLANHSRGTGFERLWRSTRIPEVGTRTCCVAIRTAAQLGHLETLDYILPLACKSSKSRKELAKYKKAAIRGLVFASHFDRAGTVVDIVSDDPLDAFSVGPILAFMAPTRVFDTRGLEQALIRAMRLPPALFPRGGLERAALAWLRHQQGLNIHSASSSPASASLAIRNSELDAHAVECLGIGDLTSFFRTVLPPLAMRIALRNLERRMNETFEELINLIPQR